MSVAAEFAGVRLGDGRLDARLGRIVEAADAKPGESFPDMMGSEAELEGLYRFVRNPKVTLERLMQSHVCATAGRMSAHGEVLVIHDTTEFRFLGEGRHGLGTLGTAGQGFLGHFSLAVAPGDTSEPLGMLAIEAWVREGDSVSKRRKRGELTRRQARNAPGRESERWARGVAAAENAAGSRATLIHVMDSEADDYALLAQLVEQDQRFVIRLGRDRPVEDAEERRVRAAGKTVSIVATRSVTLSRRKSPISREDRRRQAREERVTTLSIGARKLSLIHPLDLESTFPKNLQVNAVYVTEINPPKDGEIVEWILFTSERIKTKKQILRVVDIYRKRWLIEEYFKALKTGCDFQKRQLESKRTLLAALGIFIPIAWNLLRLRTLARTAADASARLVLTPTQLRILRAHPKSKMPSKPTVRQALFAIARLGGLLRSNGDPGWLVLGRGYQHLLTLETGVLLAREKM